MIMGDEETKIIITEYNFNRELADFAKGKVCVFLDFYFKEGKDNKKAANEIGIKLGATWIPEEIIRQFMFELLDTPVYATWDIKVRYSKYNSEWYIENKNRDRSNVKAYKTYGTDRINAYKTLYKIRS